jgi:hypothetical protein
MSTTIDVNATPCASNKPKNIKCQLLIETMTYNTVKLVCKNRNEGRDITS